MIVEHGLQEHGSHGEEGFEVCPNIRRKNTRLGGSAFELLVLGAL